ncbi:hypothetical protein MPTK1_6g03310 [Marchantia polymorpha subsp. ruderalis]|uniref:Uncharacterized protein n=2 Tax=Marchantia polymorpha TaxID=3197 RepID=A0AAF6BN37_MARPO|nr:hypothetical protein MARPO_0035s0111 [Marchantia polymorpha]BBN13421.1 hypothetical protein Mp_6g03310 [Marchantia polymorpha subsp. ruderalis]|eukprot:PTQ41342.1 hypothetical protein MARPO_0035s0111 [Marchantia polymorpha]
MDPLYGWLEGPVRPQFGWRFSRESCNAATPMPKALWFLTLAILMLGLHAVDAKGFEHSSVNATASPVGSGIDNVTTPLGVACLPSGSCGSRRLLQEDALSGYFASSHETHYYKHLYRRRPMSSYKLTGRIPRKDPLDNFHVYDGGFNVTDKHYWSSVAYTGIWGYVLACICLVTAIIYCFLYCCGCADQSYEDSVSGYKGVQRNGPLISICIFSCIAIIAAGVIYWGNAKLGQQLRATAGTLLTATDGIQSEINNALSMVQVASMFPISQQGSSQQFLQACVNLGNTFNNLQKKVKKNKDRVYRIFDNVKVALTVVSAVLAVFVVLGLAGTIGSWRYLLIITFGLMMILLFASWIMAGVSFALTNVANDACQIMNEYDENPQNSSISKYLPCLSNSDADKALAGAKEAIKSLVTQANVAIDWVNREESRLSSKRSQAAEFVLPRVCDPYGPPPSYNDSLCLSGETSFGDFEKVYGPFRCENDNLTHCFEQDTPIPNFAYEEADMAMNASNIVYRMLPTIFRIITCNFVKVTFEDILFHNCRPLRRSLTTLWGGFIVASLAMMPLQICWAVLTRHIGKDREGFRTRTYSMPDNIVRRIMGGGSPLAPASRAGTPATPARAGTPASRVGTPSGALPPGPPSGATGGSHRNQGFG